jgi:hypothetical protein
MQRVTTDVDLRADWVLDGVTAYLERGARAGREGAPVAVGGRCWVDHKGRTARVEKGKEDDR